MIENFFPGLHTIVLGNSLGAYIDAVLLFVVVFAALLVFRALVLARLKSLAEKTSTDIDDMLIGVLHSVDTPLYLLVALGVGLQVINHPAVVATIGYQLAFFVVVYALIKAASAIVDYLFERIVKKRLAEKDAFDPSAIHLLGKALKGAIWGISLLLVLQNLGFDITALLAGLGIGGLAVAFALQNIFSDIFASFSIYFDKPFSTGDFIIVGNDMGVVKHIGIKSTRIQTLQGQELVIPNTDLTGSRVNNYRKLTKRRASFFFGVTYETPGAKLRKIPDIVREIIGGIELADIDRVHFKEFGDSSLNYEVVYYANTTEYGVYMDIQQEINLQVKERLEKEGIEFAFPTQTIYLAKS